MENLQEKKIKNILFLKETKADDTAIKDNMNYPVRLVMLLMLMLIYNNISNLQNYPGCTLLYGTLKCYYPNDQAELMLVLLLALD